MIIQSTIQRANWSPILFQIYWQMNKNKQKKTTRNACIFYFRPGVWVRSATEENSIFWIYTSLHEDWTSTLDANVPLPNWLLFLCSNLVKSWSFLWPVYTRGLCSTWSCNFNIACRPSAVSAWFCGRDITEVQTCLELKATSARQKLHWDTRQKSPVLTALYLKTFFPSLLNT